jgi:hypothetical protein
MREILRAPKAGVEAIAVPAASSRKSRRITRSPVGEARSDGGVMRARRRGQNLSRGTASIRWR